MSASTVIARYGGLKRTYDQTRDPDPAGHSSSSSPTGFSATTPKPLQRRLSASSSILGDEKLRTLPRTASFDSAASVVLIGLRGVGKSTLGVLAATAYGRRLVEADHGFFEATGSTPTIYRRTHGTAAYQKRHFQTLERTLQDHDQGAVIICSFSDLENNGAALLRHYAQTHPVIHILREADAVRSHLHVSREGKIEELLSASTPLLRSCSNYEFYNLSEKSNTDNDSRHRPSSDIEKQISGSAKADFLALKSVERDFIRLLRNIVGDGHRGPSHHSAYPFSNIKVEDRSYTTSVTVSVSELVTNSLDLDAAQIGADCVELTVDSHDTELTEQLNNTSKAFAILRRSSILPIMLAAKNSQELTQFCLRLGPDFCALELSYSDTHLQRLIACRGVSRVIGTLHITERPDRGWNDETCLQIYTRAAGLGCALVRISMPARSADLDYSIFSFKEAIEALQLPTRLIAFETGAAGRTSKCFNQVLTPVNPVAGSKTELNDVVSSKELTEALFATFVLQPMHFFIYGAQVDYSLSPTMHNSAFAACGMPHTYTAYSRDDLDEFKSLASSTRFGGAAVTQPFKTAILSYMHGLSSHAKIIGAVNTVIPIRGLHNDGALPLETTLVNDCNRQGPVTALYGHNTDWIGIRSCVRKGLSPANAIRPKSTALVCGAGGMSRAAIYALYSLGIQNIFLWNRTHVRAVALAEYYNKLIESGDVPEISQGGGSRTRVQVIESFSSYWPKDARLPTVIVCCIPRHTAETPSVGFAVPDEWLKSPTGGVAVEVAYSQPESRFAQQVREHKAAGWVLMDGFDMLPHQAFSQFELFTGRRAPRQIMTNAVHRPDEEDDHYSGRVTDAG